MAGDRAEDGAPLPGTPRCPFCRGEQTELVNAFGAQASTATYWCRDCRSPFEILKWRPGPRKGAVRE